MSDKILLKLADDICRCHDHTCAQRDNCLRYIRRDTGGERTPHCETLMVDGSCTNRITPHLELNQTNRQRDEGNKTN